MSLAADSEARSTRRFREAVSYVSRGWLPVSPVVLKEIQGKLTGNGYSGTADLLADLKRDVALFAWVLRETGSMAPSEHHGENPFAVMRSVELTAFNPILAVPPTGISAHELCSMKDSQALRLRHLLIAATTAELLGARQGLDPELLFGCGLLRQLGLGLAVWNYPTTYARADAAMNADGMVDFDEELQKLLGFDAHRLGVEMLLAWSTCPEVRHILAPELEESELGAEQREFVESVRSACELGEALARINDPLHYPHAVRQWRRIEEGISYLLGDRGFAELQELIADRYPHYVALAPRLFSGDLSPERRARAVKERYVRQCMADNVYVRKCSETVRPLFQEVYSAVSEEEPSSTAVTILVNEVIPQVGFLRGCVYMLDPAAMVLVPRLRIGDPEARAWRAVPCSCGGARTHPVSEAFHCTTPLSEESVYLNGERISHVTGKFGNADTVGVLHLELTERLLREEPHTRLMLFKAIRQALNDCLNLR